MHTYAYLLEQFASNPSMSTNQCSLFYESQKQNAVTLGAGVGFRTDWPGTLSVRVE